MTVTIQSVSQIAIFAGVINVQLCMAGLGLLTELWQY